MVQLEREPENAYDKNAIRVVNMAGSKVGHVKAAEAAALAPLLGSSRTLVAFEMRRAGAWPGGTRVAAFPFLFHPQPLSCRGRPGGDWRAGRRARGQPLRLPLRHRPLGQRRGGRGLPVRHRAAASCPCVQARLFTTPPLL